MAEILSIIEKLARIQQELKAPKKRKNDFGNFSYRSLEDCTEAFKKFGVKYKVALKFTTVPVAINGSVYIKATATLRDCESCGEVSVDAYAKEPAQPKAKMDESQCTGSAASYAKKYAFNGLFLLDDSIDPDSNQNIDSGEWASVAQVEQIELLCKKHNQPLGDVYKKWKVVKNRPTAMQAGLILKRFKEFYGDD